MDIPRDIGRSPSSVICVLISRVGQPVYGVVQLAPLYGSNQTFFKTVEFHDHA